MQNDAIKLETAFDLHQQGRLDQAEALYKEVLQSQPEQFDALRLLATLHRQRRNPLSALELFDRALKIDPAHPGTLNNRGNALLDLNRPEQALDSYDRALQLNPAYAEAQNNRGLALAALQRPEQALHSYEQALAINPNYAEAYYNRGLALLDLQRPEQALDSYDKALKIKPHYPEALNNRGIALARLQRLAPALDSYDRAIAIDPGHAEALFNRGNALAGLKRLEPALRDYQRVLALKPDYPEAHHNRGLVLAELHRYEQALASYDQALAIRPDYAEALGNRGMALLKLQRLEAALDSYERALAINPDAVEILINRGNLLVGMRQPGLALQSFDTALAANPDHAEALNNRGIALVELNRHASALDSYTRAIALKSGYPEALNNRGTALMELNRLAEAEADFRAALAIDPDFVQGRYSLTLLNDGIADPENLGALTAILAAGTNNAIPLTNEQQALLHFALGRCHNAAGDPQQAFANFLAGCKLKRAALAYDANRMARYFAALGQVFDRTLIDSLRGGGESSALPIFIIGMPRSGTTLIEQIVSSHPEVHGGGELTHLIDITQLENMGDTFKNHLLLHGQNQLAAWGSEYLAKLQARAPGARRITDKMPNNFFAVGLIHLMLPNARIIHVNRNPLDTCLSCLSTWFRDEHGYSYDMAELGRYYRDYRRLMAHWRQVLPGNAFLDVHYEELVANQEAETRRIIDYCGLEWNAACMDFHNNPRRIATASLMQVRQPLYTAAVGRWRSYQQALRPLLEILGELAPD